MTKRARNILLVAVGCFAVALALSSVVAWKLRTSDLVGDWEGAPFEPYGPQKNFDATIACLPRRDAAPEEPCMKGLQDQAGVFYAVMFMDPQRKLTSATGTRVYVNGYFDGSRRSADHDVAGLVTVGTMSEKR